MHGLEWVAMAQTANSSAVPKSLYARGMINRKSLNLLIDSGAVVSILSEQCAKWLNLGTYQPSLHKLIGASGSNLEVLGSLNNVLLTFGPTSFLVNFVIVKNLVTYAVLGADFLINNGILCDFDKMLLSKGNTNIPLIASKSSKPEILVSTKSNTEGTGTFKFNCTVFYVGPGNTTKPIEDGLYLYQPNVKFWGPTDENFCQDDVEYCLVEIKNSCLNVCAVSSEENVRLFIPKHTVVGKLKHPDSAVYNVQSLLSPEEKKIHVISKLKIDENPNMSQPEKNQFKELVCEFIDVFSENKFDIGYTDVIEAEIKLNNGDEPIVEPYRRAPIHLLPKVAEEIEKLLEAGVIK